MKPTGDSLRRQAYAPNRLFVHYQYAQQEESDEGPHELGTENDDQQSRLK